MDFNKLAALLWDWNQSDHRHYEDGEEQQIDRVYIVRWLTDKTLNGNTLSRIEVCGSFVGRANVSLIVDFMMTIGLCEPDDKIQNFVCELRR